jgi:phosphatidylserine/phosphatidylglycerophosphate/cardiolipin synthase-like enzyme
VGSADLDDRSFHLNDEADLNMFSAELARQQIGHIEADIRKSKTHGIATVGAPLEQ